MIKDSSTKSDTLTETLREIEELSRKIDRGIKNLGIAPHEGYVVTGEVFFQTVVENFKNEIN